MILTLEQGQAILQGATTKAKEIGVAASVVVLDGAGHLKAFYRMDGAWLGSIDVAMKKARTSVLFEIDTQSLWDICKPGAQAHGLDLTNGGLVTFAGGIALKTTDGMLLGAVGVSGGQVSQDFEIASAASAALAN
jgi:uncharacterized protein GlcG (DUF336 family)